MLLDTVFRLKDFLARYQDIFFDVDDHQLFGARNPARQSYFLPIFFESRSGYMDQLSLVFTKSLPQSGRSVLRPGDWRILLLCLYIPAPFTESFDRLGRRIVFASKVQEQESNSSYTAQVDLFPSALSTRSTLLPFSFARIFVMFSKAAINVKKLINWHVYKVKKLHFLAFSLIEK